MYGWGGVHDQDATFTATESGYMDDEAGFEYISEHFDHHINGNNKNPKPHLLIVDGHSSHVYWRVIQYALSRNIHMICLPPHSTHIMQPLDVGCFGVLSKAYKNGLRDWVFEHAGGATFTKRDFWEVLSPARDLTYKPDTIKAAWKSSGCWPIDSWRGAPNATAEEAPGTPPQRLAYKSAISEATPYKLKTLSQAIHKQLTTVEDQELLHRFTELSLAKVTKYRDIQPLSNTLRSLRNGKVVQPLELKFVGKGRLLNREQVNKGIARLLKRKEDEEAAEIKKLEKATAKAKAPPKKRITSKETPPPPSNSVPKRGKGKKPAVQSSTGTVSAVVLDLDTFDQNPSPPTLCTHSPNPFENLDPLLFK